MQRVRYIAGVELELTQLDEQRKQLNTSAAASTPGMRAAAVMSLIQSAKLNGHDPYLYMKDVLTRLPTTKQKDIELLLPHRWQLT